MNKYELGLIISSTLDEEAYKAELEKVQSLITRFGGTIDKVDEWGKRRLSYEISKQIEGYYVYITFTSEANAPKEVEDRIRIFESLLRYLIVRLED